ncbi:hypothetical protein D3C87_371130 [compost metagenome]
MMRNALLLISLICLSQFVSSQDGVKRSMIGNLADEESGYNIVADNQGNTYVGGLQNKKTLLVKQDASNNTLWTKTLSYTTAVNQFSTLTFLDLVGDTLFGCGKINRYSLLKGIFYFKMNAQTGAVYWSKCDTTSMGYVSCMRYANNKFFLVGGVRPNPQTSTTSNTAKALAVSSQTGNIIWQTPLLKYDIPYAPGSAVNANAFLDATEMVNGKMFITGYVSGHLGGITNWIGMPLLVGISETGNLFMERIIHLPYQGIGSNDMKRGSKIRLDMNGDLIIECLTTPVTVPGPVPVGNLILVKTDILGNLIFCKYYRIDNNANVYPQALNETSGNYVLFGTTYSNYGAGSSVMKVAKNGNPEYCILVSKPNVEHLPNSSSTADIVGNSSFINGQHYFAVTEITNSVIEPDINKIILDENLGTVGDCSELVELTTSVVDVPITITPGITSHIPHSIVVQNGGVWENIDPFTFCNGVSVDLVQNGTCQASVTANTTGLIDPVFYWSNGTAGSNTIPVNTTDTIFVRVLDTKCCELFDTIVPVLAPTSFVMNLPADTTVCLQVGNAFTITPLFSGANAPVTYLWSNNSTGSSLSVVNSGTYWVELSDSCVTRRDSIVVTVNSLPLIGNTGNVTVCEGSFPAVLNPTVSVGSTVLWDDGSTAAIRSVNGPGIYSFSVTNTCGTSNASITVSQTDLPDISLVSSIDTCILSGTAIVLSPVFANATGVLWSNGSTASQLAVSSPGTYTVSASNGCGTSSATVVVTLNSLPAIGNVGNVAVCEGNFPVTLNPTVSAGASVLWENGSTAVNRMVNGPGTYTIAVTNDCGTLNAAISVTQTDLPAVQLISSIDTCIQSGTAVTLSPIFTGTTAVGWSDGSAGSQLSVSNSGIYTVYAFNVCGTDSASSSVTINHFPELNLPAILDTCFEVGVGFSYTALGSDGAYQWSSGSQTATEWISQEGIYSVTLVNQCGTLTKSMQVRRYTEVSLYFPQDSVKACAKQYAVSNLQIETNYTLEVFAPNGNLVGNKLIESGWYLIHAFNPCGEKWDSIYVNLQNEQFFYLPNSFTPNGDSHNDRFEFKGENIVLRDVQIFNRWGEAVFSENGSFTGWDGTYRGEICPDGIYAVSLIYEDCFGMPTEFNGHVNLLK